MQAFFCSLFIHLGFIISTFGWTYIKTKFEKPTILGEHGDRYVAAHTDVVFVFVGSPIVFLGITFIGITIVCGFIITLTKKHFKTRGVQ